MSEIPRPVPCANIDCWNVGVQSVALGKGYVVVCHACRKRLEEGSR